MFSAVGALWLDAKPLAEAIPTEQVTAQRRGRRSCLKTQLTTATDTFHTGYIRGGGKVLYAIGLPSP